VSRLYQISGVSGKHVLVTGAAGLLASEICLGLAENKAKLSLLDTDTQKLVSFNSQLRSNGTQTYIVPPTDLLIAGELSSAIEHAENELGPIDVLIHAAYPRTSDWHLKLEQIPIASWQKNVDMNLNATFLLCQQLGTKMAERGVGNIILFSSIYGLYGPDFNVYVGLDHMTMPAAYSAIKGGVTNFVRYLASYWGKSGIRVNAICPGGILDQQDPNFIRRYEERVPMRRMGTPVDVAGAVLFLTSDLSSYVSGINLPVDGGWTAI
jgi:NAD(P)-dependent dehydrogenase (short-subunit alcohol dehydrogenase family)